MPKNFSAVRISPTVAGFSLAALSLAAAVALCWRTVPVSAQAAPDPGSEAYYTAKVKPILDANCARCHGGGLNHRGGLAMDTRANFMKGGHDGAVIVPGDPANSLLIKLIRHEGPANDPMPMPPKSKISDDDIATITAWVKGGAKMPE
jgi:cytochrome c